MNELVRGNFGRDGACPLVGIGRWVGRNMTKYDVMHLVQQLAGQFVGRCVEHEVGIVQQQDVVARDGHTHCADLGPRYHLETLQDASMERVLVDHPGNADFDFPLGSLLRFVPFWHVHLLFLRTLGKRVLALGEVFLGVFEEIAGEIVKELCKAIPTLAVGFYSLEILFGLQMDL